MADTISFDDLMASRLLDVPDYQRGYAWDTQQLREFWEDLELIEPGGRHYTGTVVLRATGPSVLDEDRNVGLTPAEVVDGQQRLTTIVILLDAVFDRLEVLGDPDTPSNRRRLVTAKVTGVPRPKLQLGPDLRHFWEHAMLGSSPVVEGSGMAAEARLKGAALFFRDRIAEIEAAVAPEGALPSLQSLVGKVIGSLQFTLYVADDDAEVGVIFETLNQRGKPLTELEKAKNYFLFLATRLEEGQRHELASRINACWREVFTNLGKLSGTHEDQFLRAHWLATENPSQRDWDRANSIKQRFHRRRYVDNAQLLFDEVSEYVESLRQASAAYRDIVSQGDFAAYGQLAPDARRVSRQLRQAGVIQIFAPLLLAARLRSPADGAPYLALLDLCERYSVRVFLVMERRANAGQARLYSLAHELHESGDFDAAMHGLVDRIHYFASDAELEADLRNVRRNWYAKPGHKYFLYQYELHRLGGAQPQLPFEHFTTGEFKSSSTEHILPQGPSDDCWLDTFSEAERSDLTHALGNLVLTYDNSVYSNRCFDQKRDGKPAGESACYSKSILRQEQDLADLETWDPSAIEVRQNQLADWALQRWSAPQVAGPSIGEEDDDLAEVDQLM